MNKKFRPISNIEMSILNEGAIKYNIKYGRKGESFTKTQSFDDMNWANKSLKKLYQDTAYPFSHYNYSMQDYDVKSENAYFFTPENNVISDRYWMLKAGKIVWNRSVLKKAYKKMFNERLSPNTEWVVGKLKPVVFFTCLYACLFGPFLYYEYKSKQHADQLKQQELLQDKTGIQDKAKEYDATKLFNAKDSLQKVR